MVLSIRAIKACSFSGGSRWISTMSFKRQVPTLQGPQPISYSARMLSRAGNAWMTSLMPWFRYLSILLFLVSKAGGRKANVQECEVSRGESCGSAKKAVEIRRHRIRLNPVCQFNVNLPGLRSVRIDLDQLNKIKMAGSLMILPFFFHFSKLGCWFTIRYPAVPKQIHRP